MFERADDVWSGVEDFEAYEPGLSIGEIRERYGLERVIKLASNENPLGASPAVAAILRESAANLAFRYPQGGNPRLVRALAEKLGALPDMIFVGNGSDEVIDLLIRIRTQPGISNIVAFRPCFAIYATQAKMAGAALRQTDLREDFSFDFTALLKLVDEHTSLVFVTSPDNPSGRAAAPADLEALRRDLPPGCLLVIDEAYIEFAGAEASLLPRMSQFSNVAFLRTFSKIYGLAGLRIGYAVLPPRLADYMWRVRLPFSLNNLAEEAAIAALRDDEYMRKTLEVVSRGRELLSRELAAMGCLVVPSSANFIMFSPPKPAKDIHLALLKRGLILRALGSYRLPDWLRLTVGSDEENAIFLGKLKDILG